MSKTNTVVSKQKLTPNYIKPLNNKIAFCFLIIDKMEQEELWFDFFKYIDTNKYSIYIHCKENTTLKYFNKFILKNLIPTQYCRPSVINAHNLLFKQAAEDGNYKIISLCGSCVPLKTFDYIYNFLTQDNLCRFNVIPKPPGKLPMNGARGIASLQKYYKVDHIQKAANWFVLNNEIAKIIASEDPKVIDEKYGGCSCPEEHYFLTAIYEKNLQDQITTTPNLQDGGTTFTNWNEPNYKYGRGYAQQNYSGKWPKAYSFIQKEEIDYLLTRNCLFGRKFPSNCIVEPINISLHNYLMPKLLFNTKTNLCELPNQLK